MKIKQFSQIGKRGNNEDSLGCTQGLLTVCDGMGGHNYGERASAFVVEALLKTFAEPQPIGKIEIQQQLNKVQTDLNQLLEKEPELEKMGTTFTGVFITPDVWYAAHIGDSRIYLLRPSERKLWHTWDHSLVGELMRTKEITIEAGRFHPMSNRIGKAIIAQQDGKPASASIVKIDELKAGDIFLLCSDGVVEGWGDWELVQLFSDTSLSFDQKCQKLALQCDANSKDNNTAIIAEIEAKDAFSFGSNEELEWTSFAEVEADYRKYCADNEIPVEEAPVYSKPAEATPQPKPTQSTASPRPAATVSQQQKPSKPKRRRWPLVVALIATFLVVLTLAVWLILKGIKPKDEESEFSRCKKVKDYREYVSRYGTEAKHYKEAMDFIDNFVSDSIQKAEMKSDQKAKKAERKKAKDQALEQEQNIVKGSQEAPQSEKQNEPQGDEAQPENQ